ncbi:hypothetical protein HPB49_018344 [Dermacentor silvarum]|uniref:Uncharacterized protein n=1 Tax=Dermacentor silvarum TaxID=543639 RepID=A0ACB8E1D5_DERSI|nr:hypothetical protein HPB49_018344 [Dermacentor silvarum]
MARANSTRFSLCSSLEESVESHRDNHMEQPLDNSFDLVKLDVRRGEMTPPSERWRPSEYAPFSNGEEADGVTEVTKSLGEDEKERPVLSPSLPLEDTQFSGTGLATPPPLLYQQKKPRPAASRGLWIPPITWPHNVAQRGLLEPRGTSHEPTFFLNFLIQLHHLRDFWPTLTSRATLILAALVALMAFKMDQLTRVVTVVAEGRTLASLFHPSQLTTTLSHHDHAQPTGELMGETLSKHGEAGSPLRRRVVPTISSPEQGSQRLPAKTIEAEVDDFVENDSLGGFDSFVAGATSASSPLHSILLGCGAGYAIYATLNQLNCTKCRALLILDKQVHVSAAQPYYDLERELDRGGLVFPVMCVVNTVTHCYAVAQQLPETTDFLQVGNQRQLVMGLRSEQLAT